MQGGLRIAVIGCGPGGLASALFLHREGHIVSLFDQFVQPKPLGSGLLIQPSGQQVLRQLGLLDAITAKAAKVTRLSGVNVRNGKRALDMEFGNLGANALALGIHRASLFQCLLDAVITQGIAIYSECTLVDALWDNVRVRPIFASGVDFGTFDLLIDASGAHSPLSSGTDHILPFAAFWTTVDMPIGTNIANSSLDQRYWNASKMAGIMPVGINPATGNQGAAIFWSVKPHEANVMLDRGIQDWHVAFQSLWPQAAAFVEQVRSMDALTLAVYRHRTGAAATRARVFHIGDSWHCTSPQLGQGANMGLIDAWAISVAIAQAETLATVGPYYRHLRADHILLYQWLSWIFTPLYQSDSKTLPMIRDFIIHHFAKKPLARDLIAHVVSGSFGDARPNQHP